jgi:hypothetical protein
MRLRMPSWTADACSLAGSAAGILAPSILYLRILSPSPSTFSPTCVSAEERSQGAICAESWVGIFDYVAGMLYEPN